MIYLRPFRTPFLALALFALAKISAPAAVILSLESVSAPSGSTGNEFDVLLTNTGPSALTVAGFSFSLSVTNPEILFTGGTISTVAPYIFAGNSLFGPNIGSPNGQTIDASDLFDLPLSGVTIGANSSVGLGRITFTIANGASAGVFNVVFAGFPATSLSDPDAADIAIDSLTSGNITITGSTSVPEPSSTAVLVVAMAAGCWMLRRRSGEEG